MDVVGEGIGGVMDPVTEHPRTFVSPSTLVMAWVDKGVGRLCMLYEHVGCASSHRMINVLW